MTDQRQRSVQGWTPPAPTRASRDIALKGRGSFRGAFVAPLRPEGQIVVFDSRGEMNLELVLLACPEVVDVEDQPEPVRYRDENGRWREHTFDVRATMRDGWRTAYAFKAAARAAAFAPELAVIARHVPKSFADEVVLVTERDLDPIEVQTAEMVLNFRRHRWPEVDAAVGETARGLRGATTIAEIVAATGFAGRAFRSVVLHIADGHLRQVGRGVPGYATRVEGGAK